MQARIAAVLTAGLWLVVEAGLWSVGLLARLVLAAVGVATRAGSEPSPVPAGTQVAE